MRQLRSRVKPGALTDSGGSVTGASSIENRENAQPERAVEAFDEQIGDNNRRKSSSQKRRIRKKKKQANPKQSIDNDGGGLVMSYMPSAVELDMEKFSKAHVALSPISLNKVTDLTGINASKKSHEKLNLVIEDPIQSEDEQSFICKQQHETKDIVGKIQDAKKTPEQDRSNLESPGVLKETVESKLPPVVWTNPTFCSESLSEQKSCNTESTCSPGRLSSGSYSPEPNALNLSEVSMMGSEVRLEGPLLEDSVKRKQKIGTCTRDYQAIEEEESIENSCSDQKAIQLLGLQESLFDKTNFTNGKVECKSPLTSHGRQTRTNSRIEARAPIEHSNCSEIHESPHQIENLKHIMPMETVHPSDVLQELPFQHCIQNKPLRTKIEADQVDEFERGLEEEIEKELAILTKRLADLHARREARQASQDHGNNIMSCPGTPVLAEKPISQREPARMVEQSPNVGGKSRNCKGRVVSAKFLECHSKHQAGITPTSVDRKFNVRASLNPVSSRIKPQRRGASLGGFSFFAKTESVDSSLRLADNRIMHFCHASEKKELKVDRITPAKKAAEESVGETIIQTKTSNKERDGGGMSRKRTADATLGHETGLAGKVCAPKFDPLKSHGKVLSPITKEHTPDPKKATPETRRSKIFPKSMGKMQMKTVNAKATEDAAAEFPEAQLLAILRENRAFRRSPVTGKVKNVSSRYGESPRQSTPTLRSKPSDQAEKNSLQSDARKSFPDKRLSLLKGLEKYPALTNSPSKPTTLNLRNNMSPSKPESRAFKWDGNLNPKAQKVRDRSSLDCWNKLPLERKHISNQNKYGQAGKKEVR